MLSPSPRSRLCAAAVSLLVLGGCGESAVPTPDFGVDVSLPPQPAAASPLAVLVDDSGGAPATTYRLSLVDATGKVVASATPKRRSDDVSGCTVARLPVASASAHRVFFLDGDDTLMWLDTDGTTGKVRSLGNPAGTEVTVSVSPDETRMATATIVATSGGFHEEVSVSTLGGAGGGTPIFTRTASGTGTAGQVSWPVGWHGDALVMADGAPAPAGGCGAAPAVVGYDLVDPLSGQARLHLCFSTADGVPAGPPAAAGVLCSGHGSGGLVLALEGWDGTSAAWAATTCVARGVLTADGGHAALVAPPCPEADGTVVIVARGGSPAPTHARGVPAAWLDGGHVLVLTAGAAGILDASSGAVTAAGRASSVDGVLPPSL